MPDRGPDKTEWPRYFTCQAHLGANEHGQYSYVVDATVPEAAEIFGDDWDLLPAEADSGAPLHWRFFPWLERSEARELDDKLQQMRDYVPARRVQQDRIRKHNK